MLNKKMIPARTCAYVITIFWMLLVKNTFGQPGKNGSSTISSPNTVVNIYTTLTANASTGATSISVASNTLSGGSLGLPALESGDLIMIIQIQGATITTSNDANYGSITNYNNCGLYEFSCVEGLSGSNIINLAAPLVNNYSASGRTQVIRVPRLTTLSVSNNNSLVAAAWNGSVGGVLAVETTGNISLPGNNSLISASGSGFRGGTYANNSGSLPGNTNFVTTNVNLAAQKGESIAGSVTDYDALGGRYGRGAPANGGGGGNLHNAGGGGGANGNNGVTYNGLGNPVTGFATAWNLEGAGFASNTSSGGGRGGYSYASSNQDANTVAPGNSAWGGDNRLNVGGRGGRPLDQSGGSRLFFGGGGGAGDGNNSAGGSGGNGGGLVFLIVGGNVTGNGAINANGTNGQNTTGGGNDAPGGGGGGGTVVVYQRQPTGTIAANIDINATGGTGGNQIIGGNESEGPGGGGGGGYVAVRSSSTPVVSIAGGANGTTNSASLTEFIHNGATIGGAGQNTTYTPQSSLFINVSGTVLQDANGQTDATINGTGTNLSGQLYVSAVQGATVVQNVAVNGSGGFNLNALNPGTYNLVIHNNPAGQTTTALPAGFVSTAEGITVSGDGTTNGITTGSTSCAPLNTVLFGINAIPVTLDYVGEGWQNPGGTNRINVPSAAFRATDLEDGTYPSNLNGRKVTLYPAINGTLYYNNVPVLAPLTITGFNNDLVDVDPIDGPVVVEFDYAVWDDADVPSAVLGNIAMGIGGALLPANGLYLKTSLQQDGTIAATWRTLSEQNTKTFALQVSKNGILFETLKSIPASGFSQTEKQYKLVIPGRGAGKWYLRVELTDTDGKRSYSNIAMVRITSQSFVRVVPNPTRGSVLISGLDQASHIKVVATTGAVLQSVPVSAAQMKLALDAYASGTYFLKVCYKDGEVKTLRVVKH